MWFRLLICTRDGNYAKRLSQFLDKKYGDKTDVNVFTEIRYLDDYIKTHTYDVILFGAEYEQESEDKRWACPTAVLAEQIYAKEIYSGHHIRKYQRCDRLFQDILQIYSDSGKVKQIYDNQESDQQCRLYVFGAAAGGVGTTTIARAYAKKHALFEKVLYLDMTVLGGEVPEESQGHCMDDILIALKSRRDILPMKLMSAVTLTKDRYYTYTACRSPMDILEINGQDVINLIDGIRTLGEYQRVIIDVGSLLDEKSLELYQRADSIVMIRDRTMIEEKKFHRFCKLLQSIEEKKQISVFRKIFLIRNRTMKKGLTDYSSTSLQEFGWIPWIQEQEEDAIVEKISMSDVFDIMENYRDG